MMSGPQRVFILGFSLGGVLTLLGVYFLLSFTLFYSDVFGIIFGSIFLAMAVAVAFYFGKKLAGGTDDVFDADEGGDLRPGEVRTFSNVSMAASLVFVLMGVYFLFFLYSPFAVVYFLMACIIFMFYFFLGRGAEAGEDGPA